MKNEYKRMFGLDFKADEIKADGLPIYMTAKRSFFILSHGGIRFLLVKTDEGERFGSLALERQAGQISSRYEMPVAFGFGNISRAQRDSLMERNIPFISDSGQLYLPFLGMSLSDRFVRRREINAEKMMPTTQALFLHVLYRCKDDPIMKKDAAEAIDVTNTTITRASEQLISMGLLSEEVHGREHYMRATETGRKLYEKAVPYLIDPIQTVRTAVKSDEYDSCPLSGESALAACTMLNEPVIITRAVYKSDYDDSRVMIADSLWNDDKEMMSIELWKYDPALFAENGIVDPVSLALSFKENVDERIEEALEDYLENYQW